jgi:hypoxanthine phosphoribosyltransferase
MVVAIATGGVYVAEAMGYADVETVKLQRVGTATKRTLLDKILKQLPGCVTDRLRMLEARLLEWREKGEKQLAEVTLSESIRAGLESHPGSVLVIDDAVDSGRTLLAVVKKLKAVLPDADVRSAIITVTRSSAVIKPDYTLYADHTLIRFPWSGDYNENYEQENNHRS